MKWTDVMDYVITRYNHLLDIPESLCMYDDWVIIIDNIFPAIYKHNTHKFDIIYNSPKCVHCYVDELFGMIKREVDTVASGNSKTKLSIYSCHDTSILRISSFFLLE